MLASWPIPGQTHSGEGHTPAKQVNGGVTEAANMPIGEGSFPLVLTEWQSSLDGDSRRRVSPYGGGSGDVE